MQDSTHTNLVIIMIVVAVVALILALGGRGPLLGTTYYYQPASALGAFSGRTYERSPSFSTDTVVSYSKPSHYTTFGETTYYTSTTAQYPEYSYTCDGYTCWTNQ